MAEDVKLSEITEQDVLNRNIFKQIIIKDCSQTGETSYGQRKEKDKTFLSRE